MGKNKRYIKPDAVRRLEQMARQNTADRFPNVPSSYIPRKQFRDDTANGLTQCIIAFINLTGGQAERISTTGRVIMQRAQRMVGGQLVDIPSPKYIPTSGTRGSADVSATIGGRSVKIEVKIGRDRQRPEQAEYQTRVEQAGGLYYIANNFTSFVEWYERTFNNTDNTDNTNNTSHE